MHTIVHENCAIRSPCRSINIREEARGSFGKRGRGGHWEGTGAEDATPGGSLLKRLEGEEGEEGELDDDDDEEEGDFLESGRSKGSDRRSGTKRKLDMQTYFHKDLYSHLLIRRPVCALRLPPPAGMCSCPTGWGGRRQGSGSS